ncbi:glycosyltransferase family 39 protein [Candidatus Roizmanbacteria bacterium]|nr:glycosyltransferase family 39 protein [Candidatus Roizmanbacteria bacterium]
MKKIDKRLALILLFGLFLRIISLNQSLWLDEGVTAKVVRTYGLLEIPEKFSVFDFHPPLYYFFLKIWTAVFGSSEAALRLPSVIFSLLAAIVVYRIGCRLKNRQVGLWSSLLFLLNPLIVYYSQEARMYMMAVFFLTASLYFFVGIVNREKRPTDNLGFILFSFLGMMTFYGSAFLIVSCLGYLLVKRRWKESGFASLGLITSLILLSPLLRVQVLNAKTSLGAVLYWKNVLGGINMKNLLLISLKFVTGRISFAPKILYYIVSAFSVLVIVPTVWNGIRKKFFLGFLFFAPIALAIIFSFFSPLLQYFRFLYLLPVLSLLIAIGGAKKEHRVLAAFIFTAYTLTYLLRPNFHRENWKALTRRLPSNTKIYMILPSADVLNYYAPRQRTAELRTIEKATYEKIIYIVPYTAEIYGNDYAKILRQNGYIRAQVIGERGVSLERWEKL